MFREENPFFADTDSPPVRPAERYREAVQVEIVFVERPIDDPLMGETLWQDLDEVGAVDAATRTKLESRGLRIGHCGASPPAVLQRLLGLKSDIVEYGSGDRAKVLSGQRVGLPAGDDYEVQVSPIYPHCDIRLAPDDDTTKPYEDARCVLRLSAEPFQEGWVRLALQPEIHHGEHRLRHVATDEGFRLRESQQIVPLYPLKFAMELGLHEMAVIGWRPTSPDALGRHFFVGHDDEAYRQRLLVVRVTGVEKSKLVAVD